MEYSAILPLSKKKNLLQKKSNNIFNYDFRFKLLLKIFFIRVRKNRIEDNIDKK